MALSETEVFIAGTGHLWLGEVGTTLPAPNTDPTAPPGDFIDAGYTEEEGVAVRGVTEISEHRVWQNTSPVRRARRLQVQEIQAGLVQHNESNYPAAFGGGSIDTSGGFPTYTFPIAGDALAEYAVVLDVTDGDRNARLVVPRMNSGLEDVEIQFNADNMAVLQLLLRSLATDVAPYWIFDDAASFAASS
jgi:hypothetical protein